jgi:DNA-binding response OmpR family regulator
MTEGRILIVDDSDNIRSVLQMNFEWLGYQVTCARDGEEALRMVAEQPPELIILDVVMPRRNGYQVCRSLKTDPRLSEIPIIFLTAKDQKEDRFWGKDCGADEYLTKPFSAAKLERVIERLLAERRRRQEGGAAASVQGPEAPGGDVATVWLLLDRKALSVFRQKYGEIRYREAVEGVRQTIEVVLAEEFPESVLEPQGEGAFRVALPCPQEAAGALAARICLQCDLLLRSFYAAEDAERGYVVSRASAGGAEVHVPILSLEARAGAEAPDA